MSTETNTAQAGGGEALAAQEPVTQQEGQQPARAPRNDAEAAAMEQAEAAPKQPEQPDAKAIEEKRKNRTKEFIERITRENAELRKQVSGAQPQQQPTQRQAPGSQQAADGEPTLEDHDFDVAAYTRAHSKWAVDQALKEREAASQQQQASTKQIETEAAYMTRVEEFAGDHPDFTEVVTSIQYQIPTEVQLAIMAHEKGPQIAYHLGNNEDDAFALAATQPHLAAAAVQRIAARLSAAPAAPAPAAAPQAPTPQVAAAAKPISKAPAPAPTLGGRTPTDIPPEKMTDEQWFAREREKARKR
ncbi:hypothetical protein [Lysobacter capsici]|uniref:hypothetical protein n=1 Tax=Lysobacter capsici TaxID=435897 RepID=UPI00287B8002|nr:hypothetical protein [Lysobacter capsici]WND79390.1 hypothetical protein RJ610_19115 [Lysobacter capsici]WND84586.1 hypothetical protein RJ609_19130 [Lysobacter capsici]